MPLRLIKRGRIFYLRGSVAGQRVYESTGLGERRTAEAFRVRRENELQERHAFGRAATATFAEAAMTYIQAGGEARYLGPLLEYFGPRFRLSDVTNDALNDAAAMLYPNAKPATINRQVIVPVAAVVNMAAKDDLCPHRRFRHRPENNRRLRWLTPEEVEALLSAAAKLMLPRHPRPERYTLQKIAFLLGSGCRPGECFAAEVKHWNAGTRQWWIPAVEDGAGKTDGAARWVRLPQRSVDLIGDLPEVGRAFRTAYGKPIILEAGRGGQMQTSFNAARDAAGLGPDVTPYVLRHTWATWFYAQTRDFGGLMDLGGWTKADTANRYRKIAPDDLADRLYEYGWDFTRAKNVQRRDTSGAPSLKLV